MAMSSAGRYCTLRVVQAVDLLYCRAAPLWRMHSWRHQVGRAVKAVKRRNPPRHSPGSPANHHSPASMFKFVMFFNDAAWISTGEAFRVVQ